MDTQNHIIVAAGFSNVYVNWDYSPTREIAALIYPAMEYSLFPHLFIPGFCLRLTCQHEGRAQSMRVDLHQDCFRFPHQCHSHFPIPDVYALKSRVTLIH